MKFDDFVNCLVSMEDYGGITTITPSEALRLASAGGQVHRVRQLLADQTVSGRDQVSPY